LRRVREQKWVESCEKRNCHNLVVLWQAQSLGQFFEAAFKWGQEPDLLFNGFLQLGGTVSLTSSFKPDLLFNGFLQLGGTVSLTSSFKPDLLFNSFGLRNLTIHSLALNR
jgi:hypothetical protein